MPFLWFDYIVKDSVWKDRDSPCVGFEEAGCHGLGGAYGKEWWADGGNWEQTSPTARKEIWLLVQ